MRFLKRRSGLTISSGFTEIHANIHTYNVAMQDFAGVTFETSEQHKEAGKTRMRDNSHTQKVINLLEPSSLLTSDLYFCHIVTGITADPTVNVHNFNSIDNDIVTKLKENQYLRFFRKDLRR